MIVWSILSTIILAIVVLLGFLGLLKKAKDKKAGFPLSDERTQKLNFKAAYYSLFLVQYFAVAYLFIEIIGGEFFGVSELESGYAMIEVLIVSGLSFFALRWLFGRRGEP